MVFTIADNIMELKGVVNMKSLSIKIPMHLVGHMDSYARLNPQWIAGFLILNKDKELEDKPMSGRPYHYTFKVDNELHKAVKLKAIEHDLPINEFVGRLLEQHYRG